MFRERNYRHFACGLVTGALLLCIAGCPQTQPTGDKFVMVAWNNLGMHCYDGDYSVFGILPPYNTLVAQVIQVGDPPKIVTDGFAIHYEFPGNTYSAGKPGKPDKTNFWQYAQQLFHLASPLAADTGLTGLGLTGDMKAVGDHFEAEGIPLTELRDRDVDTAQAHPYQLAKLTLTGPGSQSKKDATLANLAVVAPVSTEFSCANCHADDADATINSGITPTGNVKANILAVHDLRSGTTLTGQQPVLCADCHASNALGLAGTPGVKSLSYAMHSHHKDLPDITPDTDGCYNCHPGPKTQCLRDTMAQNYGVNCTNCHGTIADVADVNREPWLQEPVCGATACHGPAFMPDKPLYRESRGHGGIYCAGCHDSPHAITPSREFSDGIKFIQLQGHTGSLSDCTVCHLTKPADMFHHANQVTVQ